MINLIKAIQQNKLLLGCLFILSTYQMNYAQITGTFSVAPNSQHTYSYTNGTVITLPNWQITGGTLVSSSQSGTTYTAIVDWGGVGTGSITFKKKGVVMDSQAVTIATTSGPQTPEMPLITNNCNSTRLTRGTPPTGDIWYWQTTSTGTSTTNSAQYIDLTSGTTYYLRAYNSASTSWSTAAVINYSVSASNCGLSNKNYIYSVSPQVSATSTSGLQDNEKIESVTYFDGLGRPVQSISIRGGGNGEDIIVHTEYDALGRQTKEYLPYHNLSNGGAFMNNALSATTHFYNTSTYEYTTNPYSEKLLESSPLNRVLKQAAPGTDWGLGSGHEIQFAYQSNTTNEVRYYDVSLTLLNNIYTPTLEGGTTYYAANELYKTVTKDENWVSGTNHTTEEFKDKQGRVVLKRTYNNGAHDTYYVYDDYGNLTYVLPPKSEPHTAKPDATKLSELCYQYKYDYRNRLVEKKIPGKGWEYIIYNKLDQPILTQDANLSTQSKWLFTKYDAFGRVAYTGVITNGSSRMALQSAADSSTLLYVTKNTSPTTIAGTTIYYTNDASVYPTTGITELYTINYYDDYTFDKDGLSLPSTADGQAIINYNDTNKVLTRSLATGSKVRVLGTSNWITTLSGYDVKGRPIYSVSKNNYLSTTDIAISTLDFVGKVDKITTTHSKTGQNSITTVETFDYDDQGRLTSQKQKINLLDEEVLVQNTYDRLGQLIAKGVGGKTTQGRLQTVDYTYNIRGWLKGINDIDNLGSDLFGFKLNYNTTNHGGTALYNGNIAETEWKTQNDNTLHWYNYQYDALNRITGAISDNFDRYGLSSVSYDKNGNITNLTRKGHVVENPVSTNSAHFGTMDILTYSYQTDTNRLMKVADAATVDQYGFKDDAVNTAADTVDDYAYDANGNMTSDTNKNITAIAYNHLNLPTQVTIGFGNIQYIYDATGVKQKKIVSTGTTTEYAGNYMYENNVLKFFNHAEGYVEPDGFGFKYVYQYKDHLGNIRLSYKDISTTSTASIEIVEENNYYPFGLKHKGYNNVINGTDHKYGFGGKEEQDELGLGWIDIMARNYNPALGRWMNIDPLAEQYYSYSSYTYTLNNPIVFSDPDGRKVVWGNGLNAEERQIIGSLIYQLRKNSKAFNSIFEQLHNSESVYTVDDNWNADAEFGPDRGAPTEKKEYDMETDESTKSLVYVESKNKGGSIRIPFNWGDNFPELKLDKTETAKKTLVEEFVHASQWETLFPSSGETTLDFYLGMINNNGNYEFEAKAITGIIHNQAGWNILKGGDQIAAGFGVGYKKNGFSLSNYFNNANTWQSSGETNAGYKKNPISTSVIPTVLINILKAKE